MCGADEQTGVLFSYLSPEAMVPEDHPLRAIRPLVRPLHHRAGIPCAADHSPAVQLAKVTCCRRGHDSSRYIEAAVERWDAEPAIVTDTRSPEPRRVSAMSVEFTSVLGR